MKRFNRIGQAALAMGTLWLAGCGGAGPAAKDDAAAAAAPPAVASPAASTAPVLPVSLNAVMVALVDDSSDAIFEAATKAPKTVDEWRSLEYHAYQMAVHGTTIKLAGTGPLDAQWVADPRWAVFADGMSGTGMEALRLAQEKSSSADAWWVVGNKLVEACEGCHKAFKPDLPTMGILHKPTI